MAEITSNGSNKPIINYGVSSREGKIYRSSKVEEEGYQRIEMQNGGVTYHKYINGLSGKLTYMNRDVKEIVVDGKKKKLDNFKIFLNDGEFTQALSVGTYSQEWKLLLKSLYNVNFDKGIILSFYKNTPEGGDRAFLNSSVKYLGETTADNKPVYPEWLDTKTVSKGGQVPDPTKNKKDEWDWTDNDIWYLERMEELIKRFLDFKETKKSSSTGDVEKSSKPPVGEQSEKPTFKEPKLASVADDLPF